MRATVICIDVQDPDDENVSRAIKAEGGTAFYFQCDIAIRGQVDYTIGRIEKEIGGISMLYHCCSLPSPRSVTTTPPSVKETLDKSVTSYFYVSIGGKWGE
jgi:all-trans-retinol dehydrogenase (NAD+)